MELVFLWIAYGTVLISGIYYGFPLLKNYLGEYGVNLQDTFDRLLTELTYLEKVSNEVEEQYNELMKKMDKWNEDLKNQLKDKKTELQKKHENVMNATREDLSLKLNQQLDHFKKNELKAYISNSLKDFLQQYFLQHKHINEISLKRVKSIAMSTQI